MSNIDKFDLLSNLISLINAENYEATITNLSADLKLPPGFIRKAMLTLLGNQVMQSCLYYTENEESPEEESLIEQYLDHPDEVAKRILKGDYDDLVWSLELHVLDSNEHELLPLTHMEYSALKALGEDTASLKRQALFEKKDNINPLSVEVKKNRETLIIAKDTGQAVSFTYKGSDNTVKNVQCYPVDLITNVSDNWIYMQAADGKSYRLDRIVHSCRLLKNAGPCPETKEDPKRKYVWGSYYNKDVEPAHVKLRIDPETRNIIAKIRNDIRYRSDTCKFYQDDNCYYYEDDIVGLPEFQRWIRGYGSSIVVIEPEELRNEIVNRAHKMLSYYQKAKAWSL